MTDIVPRTPRGGRLELNRHATCPVYLISTRVTFHTAAKGPILKPRDSLAVTQVSSPEAV